MAVTRQAVLKSPPLLPIPPQDEGVLGKYLEELRGALFTTFENLSVDLQVFEEDYLQADGSIPLTADWDAGDYNIIVGKLLRNVDTDTIQLCGGNVVAPSSGPILTLFGESHVGAPGQVRFQLNTGRDFAIYEGSNIRLWWDSSASLWDFTGDIDASNDLIAGNDVTFGPNKKFNFEGAGGDSYGTFVSAENAYQWFVNNAMRAYVHAGGLVGIPDLLAFGGDVISANADFKHGSDTNFKIYMDSANNRTLSVINDGAGTLSLSVEGEIYTSGNVGIGTSSPDSILHIKANIPGIVGSHHAGQLIIQNPNDSVFGNVAITGYESDGDGNPDQQLWYLGSSSVGNTDIIFLNRRNANLHLGTNGVSRLTILGNGNVGIGTTNPSHELDVVGDANITGTAIVANLVASGYCRMDTAQIYDNDQSHYLAINWNEDEAAGNRLLNLLVNGANRSLSLSGDLTVEATSVLNQDLTTDASPTFNAISVSDIQLDGADVRVHSPGAGMLTLQTTQDIVLLAGDDLTLSATDQLVLTVGGAVRARWVAAGTYRMRGGSDFEMYSDAESTKKFSVDGATGTVLSVGTIRANGGFNDNGNAGVDGTFTAGSGETITVSGGIITSIV